MKKWTFSFAKKISNAIYCTQYTSDEYSAAFPKKITLYPISMIWILSSVKKEIYVGNVSIGNWIKNEKKKEEGSESVCQRNILLLHSTDTGAKSLLKNIRLNFSNNRCIRKRRDFWWVLREESAWRPTEYSQSNQSRITIYICVLRVMCVCKATTNRCLFSPFLKNDVS